MNPIALHSETTSGTVKRKRMPWGEAGIPTPGERLGMGIDFKKDSLPLPPLPESLDGFSGIADLHGDSIHRKGKIARVVAPEISLTARKERQALEIPPIPALFNSGDLNLVTTSPDGEKAVMKQLKTHLERLENGARDVKTPQEKRTQAPSPTPFTPTNASCSEAAIPETFLKSQSGHDMAFVAKLPDSMFSIGRSEGSGRATQPGSRTSAEESRAFADGNASDGFGFADDSLAGGLMAGTRGGTSTLAVNRSLSFGDVSFGWGSRSISLGTRTLGNASLPDAINSSGNLSGIFREFSS